MRRPSTSGRSTRHRLWYAKLVLAIIVASALAADDDGLGERGWIM